MVDLVALAHPGIDHVVPSFNFVNENDLAALKRSETLAAGIPANGLTLLYGPPGIGKSFYALHIAFTIAAKRNCNVVYIAAEGAGGLEDRRLAWRKHHQTSAGSLWFLPDAVQLRDSAHIDTLISSLKPLSAPLLVIDTLARNSVGADENSARDMGVIIDHCTRLIAELNMSVLLLHHSTKSGGSERGSGALLGAADSALSLTRSDDGLLLLSQTKAKDTEALPDRFFRLLPITTEDGQSSCVIIEAEKSVAGVKLTKNRRGILETLSASPTGLMATTIMKLTGIASTSLYRDLGVLQKEGFVREDTVDGTYFIEAKGTETLLSRTIPTHSQTFPLEIVRVSQN